MNEKNPIAQDSARNRFHYITACRCLWYNRSVNTPTIGLSLQTVEAIVLIVVAVIVGAAVWLGFVLFRRLAAPATRTAENLAALSQMAREEEVPRKVSSALVELRDAAHQVSGASEALRRFLENEELSALPADIREAVARLQDSLERFSGTLSSVDQYLHVPQEAKQKLDLFKGVVSALGEGFAAGWQEWRGDREGKGG